MPDIADLLASLPPADREAYLDGPAHAPPDGVVPNFENPESQNPMAVAVFTAGLVIASALFLLRTYAKLFCFKQVHIEDGLILMGFGTFLAFAGCCYYVLDKPGFFVHQWNVRLRAMTPFLHTVHLGTNFYGATLLALKPAILLEWARTFVPRGTRNPFWWTCHVLLWLNVLFFGSTKIASNLACRPYIKIWDKTVQGTCLNEGAIWLSYSCLNFVSDVIILALPQRVIWRLNLSMSKKVGVSIVFAFGALACIAAALRIATSVQYLSTTDKTFIISAVTMSCWAEMVLLIVVACVPTLPKVAASSGLPNMLSLLKTWARSYRSNSQAISGMGSQTQPSYEITSTRSPYQQIVEHNLQPLTKDGRNMSSSYSNEHGSLDQDRQYPLTAQGCSTV